MRFIVCLFALLLAPAASAQTLSDLAWLKGCWRTQGDGPVITEVWLAPPMPAILGYAYTIGEGETQGWEQTRIEMIDGWPHFIATPNGDAPVRFRMSETDILLGNLPSHGDGGVAFLNPEHDFPQRVSYIRFGDTLTAEISRLDGADAITFHYRRIRCPAELRP